MTGLYIYIVPLHFHYTNLLIELKVYLVWSLLRSGFVWWEEYESKVNVISNVWNCQSRQFVNLEALLYVVLRPKIIFCFWATNPACSCLDCSISLPQIHFYKTQLQPCYMFWRESNLWRYSYLFSYSQAIYLTLCIWECLILHCTVHFPELF